jgi:hypothetical protein
MLAMLTCPSFWRSVRTPVCRYRFFFLTRTRTIVPQGWGDYSKRRIGRLSILTVPNLYVSLRACGPWVVCSFDATVGLHGYCGFLSFLIAKARPASVGVSGG